METAAEKNGKDHKKCLEESLQLQKRLRQLTHQLLTAHEAERKTISRKLQDEIAQTLLGINIRLLSLKEESRKNTKGLKEVIARAQRSMVKSVTSVCRVAHNLGTSCRAEDRVDGKPVPSSYFKIPDGSLQVKSLASLFSVSLLLFSDFSFLLPFKSPVVVGCHSRLFAHFLQQKTFVG